MAGLCASVSTGANRACALAPVFLRDPSDLDLVLAGPLVQAMPLMAVQEVRPPVAKAPTDSHRRVVVPLRRRAAAVPLCLLMAATLRVLVSSLPTLDDSLLPRCLQEDTRGRCTSHPAVRSLQLLERLLRPQSPLA